MSKRLLCVGLTTLDILGRPIDAIPHDNGTHLIEEIEVVPAGTAGGAALVAATLGLDTALVSAIGADNPGRFLRMALEARGVGTRLVETLPGLPTSATIFAIDAEARRPNFHAFGASMMLEIADAAIEAACAARFVHWGATGAPRVDGGPGASLLRAARAAGATITCDLIVPGPQTIDELRRILPYVDYFMPSLTEARLLSGTASPARAADFFMALGARNCIFKAGEGGSFLALEGERLMLPAHDIRPVDTTGCGNAYCGGFIAALDRGFSPVDACRFATAAAALVAQGLGTLGKLESFDATLAAGKDMPLRTASA